MAADNMSMTLHQNTFPFNMKCTCMLNILNKVLYLLELLKTALKPVLPEIIEYTTFLLKKYVINHNCSLLSLLFQLPQFIHFDIRYLI